MADICVVMAIPVHNRREVTLTGLRTILAADRNGIDLRVVILDDGSTDGTGDAIRSEFPQVDVIEGDGSLFYTGGTNAAADFGIRTYSPRYVVTANDDAEFDRGFLEALVGCAEQHPRSVVGALLTQQGRPGFAFQVGQQWSWRFGGWRVPHDLAIDSLPTGPFEVECIVGNCLIVPTTAIEAVGLLDAKHFPFGFGDAEWSVRMRDAGWRQLVDPAARVDCEPNTLPTPLRERGARAALRVFFLDRSHPLNLNRQWTQLWLTAPSKPQAILAFAMLLGRHALKAVGLGSWPRWPDPPVDYRPA